MKLFGEFEAIRFNQEGLIFITNNGYLYYIYSLKNKHWRKYHNAGNVHLTVSNYDDVSKEELLKAMNGFFPKSETDFMRLCDPSQLWICNMIDLLEEDYETYMSNNEIYYAILNLLKESNICHKSFEKIQKLLSLAVANNYDNAKVDILIKELSLNIIGVDIFKKQIVIVDGHDGSSYFWIMPVRIIDNENTSDLDSVAEMKSVEISIEEDDVYQYLTPFLNKHFNENLEANKNREYVSGFEWNLEHNFFTFNQMEQILKDIAETIEALVHEKQEDDTEVELIVDFYERFIYRMEYMMKVGKEKGYDLISFMGP